MDKLYYQIKSLFKVNRTMQKRYHELEKIKKIQIQRIVKIFEATDTVGDCSHNKTQGISNAVSSYEIIELVQSMMGNHTRGLYDEY